ncbi:hypothetical protein PSN13_05171 [Micromonospora saelicesensis]|uniref:Uncharacterized protein n=1 Tax=Micromonospora saelicesensis TaxID=285676 RepID=A0A328NH72_9ACTN|nr:hypothetical protein [Micromonospora saelicesensis]RAO29972.1 hypothetical protein PSN13_05171 [Micromonospora saelicesensis]
MSKAAPKWTYNDFSDHVRRFNQESVLDAVVAVALTLPGKMDDDPRRYQRTPPWALAAVVKASLCNGNAHRSTPMRERDLVLACHMHNNLHPEELDHPHLGSPLAIMVRIGYEQFPYQESMFEEMARAEAFFNGYTGSKPLTVVTDERLAKLLGAPVREAAGVALLLHAGAERNGGFFDPKWLDQSNFTPVLDALSREAILDVVNTSFASDVAGFKRLAAEAPAVPLLDKYLFNPLMARPFIRRKDGRLIAPVPQLISRRMSPLEWYYAGIREWGTDFAIDLGYLFEDYVGRQFATVPDASVEPEIEYHRGKDRMDTTDWFIVFDDAVLLVEAKAGILPAAGRAGDDSLTTMMTRTVGKAIKQINRTHALIKSGAPEVVHIPNDRPILAMVATLDPWYMANSFLGHEVLPTCDVPVTVCSARDIEFLVSIGQRTPVGPILTEIVTDPERSTWSLGIALKPYRLTNDRNPLLDQAWKQYPFN